MPAFEEDEIDTGKQTCSACGYVFDRASYAGTSGNAPDDHDGPHLPHPGSLSLCINCGHLALWGEGMIVRELTEAERFAIPMETAITIARLQAARIQAMRGMVDGG